MQKHKQFFFYFFLCPSDVCKNQKPSLNYFGFLNVPLTQLTPMTQNYFFQIALFTSFPMISISYFCKINWIFGKTFSESMSGYSAVLASKKNLLCTAQQPDIDSLKVLPKIQFILQKYDMGIIGKLANRVI